ncbi:pyrroloquinoline quinone precursor peptide PqqA [Streptomyces sp. NPDC005227]
MLDNTNPDQQTDTTTATTATTGWVTPDFMVVDTAMEVTAYSLSTL